MLQLAPFYPYVYRILKPTFRQCLWNGHPHSPQIALTFDDGPHPEYTPQLLKVLDKYQIPASFFWLGVCVERIPEIARSVFTNHHWLGIHGYYHHNFPFLSPEQLQNSLVRTQRIIANACNLAPENIVDVRPPNGLFTPKTLKLLRQWNFRPVMWSVVPEDWVRPGIEVVNRRVLSQVRNGSIIVLHDGYYGGQDVAATVDWLIPKLQERGYEFVTIPQLWQSQSCSGRQS